MFAATYWTQEDVAELVWIITGIYAAIGLGVWYGGVRKASEGMKALYFLLFPVHLFLIWGAEEEIKQRGELHVTSLVFVMCVVLGFMTVLAVILEQFLGR